MTVADLLFYGVAFVTVATAAYAVFSRNIVRSVFSLLGTFFGVAVLYGMLAADFVAVVQLMVYVGGILVLLLFAVMLTSQIEAAGTSNRGANWLLGLPAALGTGVLLCAIILRTKWMTGFGTGFNPTTERVGVSLAGWALLPLCLVSLVLLGTVIAAVTLARRPRSKGGES